MIENRARIERQIFLGRQAVRRVSQNPGRQASVETTTIPARLSTTPPPTGTDQPLSVDTDAETAYAAGSRKFFRRRRQSSATGQLTPRASDGGRGIGSRNISSDRISLTSTPDGRTDPMINKVSNGDDFPSGYMSRLLAKPFPSALQLKENEMDEDGWSSESSFDDDLAAMDDHRRHPSHSSLPPIEDGDELRRDEWSG